jgi:hypothetical protein
MRSRRSLEADFNRKLAAETIFWGYDISLQAIELAKNPANKRLHCRLADFQRRQGRFS